MVQYNLKRIIRFLAVGSSNALLHFVILNTTFFFLGQTKIISSIVATCFAIMYSFFLNRSYVFRQQKTGGLSRHAVKFIIVTMIGMLLIHNTVFALSILYLDGSGSYIGVSIKELLKNSVSINFVTINLATIAGAIIAMIWNYNGYRLFVFKNDKLNKK